MSFTEFSESDVEGAAASEDHHQQHIVAEQKTVLGKDLLFPTMGDEHSAESRESLEKEYENATVC